MRKIKIEILTNELGCSKCESAMEKINSIVKQFKNVEVKKIDIIKNPKKILENNIMSVPAVFINGKLEFEGDINESKFKKKILDAGGN